MIRHVVMIKLKPQVTQEERDRWIDAVRRLADEAPVVRNLTVGSDVLHLPRSYDVALVVDFDSLDDLSAYDRHPAHVPVAAMSRQLADHIASVDFEYETAPTARAH